MHIKIRLSNDMRQHLYTRLKQAYARGCLRLVKRIHALLYIAEDTSVADVSHMLGLGEQTIRDYIRSFLIKGRASLVYKRPPGRPPKLSKTQRKELAELLGRRRLAMSLGSALMIQDLIQRRFGVEYHPHYICTLLDNMGFSFQKARFVSDHLNEAARIQWNLAQDIEDGPQA
ncbi:MAG: transposase [Dehalococcoidia bacterium]